MPGNIIKINNSSELQWYVGDSKMDALIKYLNEIGHKRKGEDLQEDEPDCYSSPINLDKD